MTSNRKILLAGALWLIYFGLRTETGQDLIKDFFDMSLKLIKEFEGFRSSPYYDVAGKLTIGYGHLIKAGESFSFISESKAQELLAKDTAEAVSAVENLVDVPLSANQKAALVSFVFNVGTGNFANSTMLKLLNGGDYAAAAMQFDRWVLAGGKVSQGLANRRAKEKALFLKG